MNINNQPQIRKKIYQKAMENKVPIVGTFELTPRCNMNCRMCYVHMNENDMCAIGTECSASEWIRIGQECRDAGMLFLLLTGGEPFLRKDFKEIYTGLNELGLIITINTNGTMITEDTIAWLKKCPPSKMNITLYGASNETYEKMCGLKNGFDKATKAIDLLIAANIRVAINATITKDNVKDLEGIYSFAKARKLPVKETVYLFPPVSELNCNLVQDCRLTPEEAGQALFDGKKYQMPEEMFKIYIQRMKDELKKADENITKDSLKGNIATEPLEESAKNSVNSVDGCMAGKASFGVTWDGKIKLCGMMSGNNGNLLHHDFVTCWNEVVKMASCMRLPDACLSCNKRSYCTVCHAVIKAECINDNNPPKYMCHITESYIKKCMEFLECNNENSN